ncbi:2,3-bisphosphoglycerate-independent phosphoglycerate mutase [Calidithermus timidus]|jgi:2,3-bisphosphoglycerate-independent phosphoglycerate mutase|uniref:2,3-bisphosphoglycerate-independent phosphoglycerate mutase n=1 Tax=Calidithermus timidus TaxID=307124 RepID=UPI00037E6134|nr:2,3-bisphosphoglycerate-independent phosphoglycerate mutase [Calidithermus timidus]
MSLFPILEEISQSTPSKILFVVLDGVGGLPRQPGGPTELAAASTPNLDALAKQSMLGLQYPVAPGIAPGSGPGHLSLFGYDPIRYQVGRGALSAIGIGAEFRDGDVGVRGNFATLDASGRITDRRAGRPSNEENARVVAKLQAAIQEIDGVRVRFYTESEHRFVVILSGAELGERVSDTDPQKTGVPPLESRVHHPGDAASARTATVLNALSARIREVLKDEPTINAALFRGISERPKFPSMQQIYKLNPACVASYPMYKGVASLVGMKVLEVVGEEDALQGKVKALQTHWSEHDFFYLHFKKTDSTGEDGDFEEKVHKVELFDHLLPELLALKPDVLVITGDHSTPSVLRAHSWHPVPVLLYGPYLRNDPAQRFTEDEAARGTLGTLRGTDLMPLMLAHAGKLQKFGA